MNRLAVSTDAGKTSRVLYSDAALQGFALADDGATVYVGAAKGGLARASTKDYRFEKRWAKGVQCLASLGSALWACTPTSSGFVVGASGDQGETFAPKLTLAGMRGCSRRQCAGPSAVAECTRGLGRRCAIWSGSTPGGRRCLPMRAIAPLRRRGGAARAVARSPGCVGGGRVGVWLLPLLLFFFSAARRGRAKRALCTTPSRSALPFRPR